MSTLAPALCTEPVATVHAVAIDWHNVHLLTDDLLDTWWQSKSGREKGHVFQLTENDTIRPENESSLAFEYACSLIESNCGQAGLDGAEWFDTDDICEGYSGRVMDAVEYLEARGLVEHHAAKPNWISLCDESEAAL